MKKNDSTNKSDIKAILGKNIKIMRKSKNLSQEQLALELGTSPKHLGYIETGNSFVSAELLEKISQYFNTPVYMLFYSAKSKEQLEDAELKRQTLISDIESIMDLEFLSAYKNIKTKIKELK